MTLPRGNRKKGSEFWDRVVQLFNSALGLAPTERVAYVRNAKATDPDVVAEVVSLIFEHEQAGSFLDSPAYQLPAQCTNQQSTVASPPPVDDSQSLIGKVIGHYRIERLIAGGGMGRVYLAHDTRLGGPVALKLLPMEYTKDEELLRRFKGEARAARALTHPSILTIYELGEEDGIYFIAAEYVEGTTIRDRISAGRMPLKEAVEVASQVANALEAVHSVGIIHRDIKPENIMLRPNGIVKVLDFGIAKLAERRSTQSESITQFLVTTEPGMMPGTPRYMSPEQVGRSVLDARTDIFSLGVVLYEMIAGRPPFEGDSTGTVFASIVRDEPPPLTEYSSEVPTELGLIVTKALRKDREERYQTAGELAQDLKSVFTALERKDNKQDTEVKPKENRPDVAPINPLWSIISIVLVAVTTYLSAVVSLRFLSGSPDIAGVLITISLALICLFAGSTFTQSGKQWAERDFSRIGVRLELKHVWSMGFAVVALLIVCALYFSLPAIARIYNNERAVQFQQTGDLGAAIKSYERAVSLDPDFAVAHYNLATAYEDVLQFDLALAEYQAALSADPKFYFASNNLARLYLIRHKDYSGALKTLNAALELKPEEPQIQYTLYKNRGWADLGLGFYDLAAEDLREALNWRDDGASAHCLLAQVLEAQKKQNTAMGEWEACEAYASGEGDVDASWLSLAQERLRQREIK